MAKKRPIPPPPGWVRIRIELKSGGEQLWAEGLGGDRYRLQNIVAFGAHLAPGDTVRCKLSENGGLPEVVEVVERGGWCTFALFFEDRASRTQIATVCGGLEQFEARFEQFDEQTFGVAITRDKWEAALAFLEGSPSYVGWELLCGPDAPTPFAGPFDLPEDSEEP